MTDKTIDIFDNVSLGYIKLKVNRLAMSDSGRGVYLKYLNAADDVFEDIFGVEKVASKIVDARTPQAVASVIKKLDYQAFFELIRMKNNLIIMSSLIQLKYELKHDRGDKESKSIYKTAVSNIQRNYRIRRGSSGNHSWLLDATRPEPEYNYFDSVYDGDESLWLSEDEPFGSSGSSRNNREYFPREFLPEDDADEFSIHLKKVEGSRCQRHSADDIKSLVEEEVRKRLERFDDEGRKPENLPSESVTNAEMMKLLKSTINALNKTNSNVSNIASSLESVSSRVDDLAGATSDAIRELYDNLENELNELEDTDDGESPPAQKISNSNGNFVRSSVEDALNQSVENALKG